MATQYIPRKGFVLIRIKVKDTNLVGIALPQKSAEGKEYYIEAIGPDITDLNVGDQVALIGTAGVDYAHIPNHKDLLLVKEYCVCLIFKHEPDEREAQIITKDEVGLLEDIT